MMMTVVAEGAMHVGLIPLLTGMVAAAAVVVVMRSGVVEDARNMMILAARVRPTQPSRRHINRRSHSLQALY
jgi:hypothetical protein